MPTDVDPYDPFIGLEAWQFTGAGKLYVAQFTGKHGEVSFEAILGGKTFHLTPAERRLNSQRCINDQADPFKNGTCVPIELTEKTPAQDRAFIESNPELISDEEIAALVKGGKTAKADGALAEKLEAISNPITLVRILTAATAADVALSKMNLIQMRIAEVTGITEGGRIMIPVTNELDSPEIYGDESTIRGRNGVAGITVGN